MLPLTRPESRGTGDRLANAARQSAVPKACMSPPVVAMKVTPSMAPMPGRLRITSACGCQPVRCCRLTGRGDGVNASRLDIYCHTAADGTA